MLLWNAYHILWLDITATQKEIHKAWKDILVHLKIDDIPSFEVDMPFTQEYRKDENLVKIAIETLNNPKTKIKDFFFWIDIHDTVDKKAFEMIKQKKYKEAIKTLEDGWEKLNHKKNIAILLSLFLEKWILTTQSAINESMSIFKEIISDEKFWNYFVKWYKLYDDINTHDDIIEEFKKNIKEYLSDLYYNISQTQKDNNIYVRFMKEFNVTWKRIQQDTEEIYETINSIIESFNTLNVSTDWIFTDEEVEIINNGIKTVKQNLKKLNDLWLYDNSKTIIIRDGFAKSLRAVALDLTNNLSEDDNAISLFKDALKFVGTDSLKQKIEEDVWMLKNNIKYSGIIKELLAHIDAWENEIAYNKIYDLEKKTTDKSTKEVFMVLKKRSLMGIMLEKFKEVKESFSSQSYSNCVEACNEVISLCEPNAWVFGIDEASLKGEVSWIYSSALRAIASWEQHTIESVFSHLDTRREQLLKDFTEIDAVYIYIYLSSTVFKVMSENIINRKSSWASGCSWVRQRIIRIIIIIWVISALANN